MRWTSWEPVQPVLQEYYGQPSILAFFEPVSIGAQTHSLWSACGPSLRFESMFGFS